MADTKHICFLILSIVNYSYCFDNHIVHRRTEEINNLSRSMYGEMSDNIKYNDYKTQNVEDNLWYPRGDIIKLSVLSSLWREYYDCSVRALDRLTCNGQVPSEMVMVYLGAVARLPCSVCAAPDQRNMVVWMYSNFSLPTSFNSMTENERMVIEDYQLVIYNAKAEDAGMYRCQLGDSSSLAVLEIVDTEEKYIVVKPETARGPYAQAPFIQDKMTVFSSWSPWSECSVCGKVGRRHRYGMCYVKLDNKICTKINNATERDISISNVGELFEAFPGGIPCRSRFLPTDLKELESVQKRRNEIMIAMCKVPCDEKIFKLRSPNGVVLETANNSAGIYSLKQPLPKQPPQPARDTIFADFDQSIVIRCPGTTLRDVPVVWRCGTKVMVPKDVYMASGGRIYFNCRDHLVIKKVFYRDANIYSCWERDSVSGAVRLVVCSARRGELCARAAALLLAALLLRAAAAVTAARGGT